MSNENSKLDAERAAFEVAPTVKAEQVQCDPAPSLPAAGSADLTAVRCQCCATEYPHDGYDAGFIAGSGMCQVCDAAMPPKDLPAAGLAVEDGPDITTKHGYPAYSVAQHERIVAALSAQQSAHVSVPECVRNWFDAKLAHVEAVDAYNTRLAFIREHMPFGVSPVPEYQIMEAADRKARELNQAMFVELRTLLNGGEA